MQDFNYCSSDVVEAAAPKRKAPDEPTEDDVQLAHELLDKVCMACLLHTTFVTGPIPPCSPNSPNN
eukprot:1824993-Amphidinium_carterae.1